MKIRNYLILAALLGLIVIAAVAYGYATVRQNQTHATTQVLLATQHDTMLQLATAIDSDRAEHPAAQALSDCSAGNRREHDNLLGRLADLTPEQLTRLQTLFAQCGDHYAELMQINVALLEDAFATYRNYRSVQKTVTTPESTAYPVGTWRELIAKEKARSQANQKLVRIQGEIIDTLSGGATVSSQAVTALVAEAQNQRETISVINNQSDALREQLRTP